MSLYTGQFQPIRHNWHKYDDYVKGNGDWLYDYYTNTTHFEARNNAGVSYNGNWDTYGAVIKNLVRTSEGAGGPRTNNNSILLPYFNQSFLEGTNSLGTKVGKVYPEVEIPFWKESRTVRNEDVKTRNGSAANGTISYYNFAARYDLLSDGSSGSAMPTTTKTRTVTQGDVGTMKKVSGTNDYYIDSQVNQASSSYSNRKNMNSNGVAYQDNNAMGFFPFNDGSTGGQANSYNYGYGMRLEIPFDMRNDGLEEDSNGNLVPLVFRFSGDDDVWVFVDGKLALDLGGDHSEASGYLNFHTGKAKVEGSVKPGPAEDNGTGTVTGAAETDFEYLNRATSGDNASKYSHHTLVMYYMERGMWESNMMIEFNLPVKPADEPKVDIELNKEWGTTPDNAKSEVTYKIEYFDPDHDSTIRTLSYENATEFKLNSPSWTKKLEGLSAFVQPRTTTVTSPKRWVYIVKEKDASGTWHEVGRIGGGVNGHTQYNSTGGAATTVTASSASDISIGSYNFDMQGTVQVVSSKEVNSTTWYGPYYGGANESTDPSVNGTYTFTATNTLDEHVTVTVEKQWKDGSGNDLPSSSFYTIPSPVNVRLFRTTDTTTTPVIWEDVSLANVSLSGSSWSTTSSSLDKYDSSMQAYTYQYFEVYNAGTVGEPDWQRVESGKYIDGFAVSYDTTTTDGTTIIKNTLPLVSASVEKKWQYNTGSGLEDLDSSVYSGWAVLVGLQQKTSASSWTIIATQELTDTTWEKEWTNLPKYVTTADGTYSSSAGAEYQYRVVELSGAAGTYSVINEDGTSYKKGSSTAYDAEITGYKVSYTHDADTLTSDNAWQSTIVNHDSPINVEAQKVFSPAPGGSNTVRLKLYRKIGDGSGEAVGSVGELDGTAETHTSQTQYENASWHYTWLNLARQNDSGQLYTYYVEEVDTSGDKIGHNTFNSKTYSVTYSGSGAAAITGNISGLTVTNESVDAILTKVWSGHSAPASAKFKLQRTSKTTFAAATGQDDIEDVGTYTISMTGTPAALSVEPSGPSVAFGTETDHTTDWILTVSGLAKADDNGDAYVYRFVEMYGENVVANNGPANNFTVSYGSTLDGGYGKTEADQTDAWKLKQTIINTWETVKAQAIKQWYDISGTQITGTGTENLGSVTVKLQYSTDGLALDNSSKVWNDYSPSFSANLTYSVWATSLADATLSVLPKYINNSEAMYRFQETTSLSGYNSPTYVFAYDSANMTYTTTIGNQPQPFSVTVTKKWLDKDGAEIPGFTRTLSPGITVKLQRKGTGDSNFADVTGKTATLTGSETTPWTVTWDNLERLDNYNAFYQYRVVEMDNSSVLSEDDEVVIGGYHCGVVYSQTATASVPAISNSETATGSGNMALSIGNKVSPAKVIVKKYKTDDETTLLDATFTLKTWDAATSTEGTGTTYSTGNDGIVEISDLSAGTYRLYETTPPTGYVAASGFAQFTVNEDGSIDYDSTNSTMSLGNTPSTVTVVPSGESDLDYPQFLIKVPNPVKMITVKAMKNWQRWVDSTLAGSGSTSYVAQTTNIPASIYVTLQRTTVATPSENDWTNVGGPDYTSVSISSTEYSTGHTFPAVEQYDLSGAAPAEYKYRVIEVNSSGTKLAATDTAGNGYYPVVELPTVYATDANNDGTYEQTLSNQDRKLSATVTKIFDPTTSNSSVTIGLYRTTSTNATVADNDWILVGSTFAISTSGGTQSFSDLSTHDANGNEYTRYRFFELDSSGNRVADAGINGNFSVTYADSDIAVPSSSGLTPTLSATITNTFQTVAAQLTKAWPQTEGSSIKIKLERTSANDWSSPAIIGTYTINASGLSTTATTVNSETAGQPSASVSKNVSGSWIITVSDLEKYDASSVAYKYRFIEMNGNSDVGHNGIVNAYTVTYAGVSTNGDFGEAALNVSTFEQTITNTPANFSLKVEKVFMNGSTNITSSVDGEVYIKLKRKVGNDEESSYNGEVKALTSTTYAASWDNLDRVQASTGSFYTYYAVECTRSGMDPNYTYTELPNGGSIQIGNAVYTVDSSDSYTVTASTPQSVDTGNDVITVTNTLVQPKIDVEKVDSSNHNTKLSGAIFSLKRVKDAAGTDLGTPDNTQTATSAASTGIAAFTNGLPDGTYELSETAAPVGYAAHSGKITFTVTNGIIAVGNHDASGLTGSSPFYTTTVTDNVVHYQFVIENTAGTELPGTGTVFGLSRMGFASLGTVLLAAFVVVYQYKKRRQYNGEDEEN